MIIIGEKINTSIKSIKTAVEDNNKYVIEDIAKKQIENGANYLDINCGTFINNEVEKVEWLIKTVQNIVDIPFCIDSPNEKALEAGLRLCKTGVPLINSITAEKKRWEAILPLVVEYKTAVIALCMNDDGIPDDSDTRLKIAVNIAEGMTQKGVNIKNIYFDPMVKPISTDSVNGLVTLETMQKIKKEIPEAHLTCGLSNISYGLPVRKLLNQAFLVCAIFAGLDTAIVDPLDKKLMSLVYASEAIIGKDEYCMNYINKYRDKLLEQ